MATALSAPDHMVSAMPSTKGEQTRATIAEVALRMFREQWLYSMGIVLYWVHDTSQGCEKTYRLIDSTAPLAERLIRLARLPGPRSLTRRLLRVADDVLH
jgi:hypothetical protein